MILTCPDTNPQRFQSVFDCDTRIMIQVRGPQTITLSRDQGEAAGALDGVQFTQATTNPPFTFIWQGQLWYKSDTPNTSFNIVILGEVGGRSSQS
jgi:hypothetical protein